MQVRGFVATLRTSAIAACVAIVGPAACAGVGVVGPAGCACSGGAIAISPPRLAAAATATG